VDKAVVDTNGNKWFHAYESSDSNGDGFNESFIYEYSAQGVWLATDNGASKKSKR
jgi:hypothetical protein